MRWKRGGGFAIGENAKRSVIPFVQEKEDSIQVVVSKLDALSRPDVAGSGIGRKIHGKEFQSVWPEGVGNIL